MTQRCAAGAGFRAVVMIAAAAMPLAAQADGSHLTLGVGVGWVGGTPLWDVPNQPILSMSFAPDLFHLRREVGAGATLTGYGTYFPTERIGLVGELTFLGLAGSDSCTVTQDGGDPGLLDACRAISNSPSSITATTVQGGLLVHPLGGGAIRPYLKGMIGIAFTPGSTVAMRSFYDGSNVLTIYQDDQPPAAKLTWSGGIGVVIAPGSAYQFFVEARDSWFKEAAVTGPTSAQGSVPPNTEVLRRFPSLIAGLEVVLERRRTRTH